MSVHDAVTVVLVYLAIGALVWVALYSAGLIQQACAENSRAAVVLVSIGVFVGWPVLAFVFGAGLLQGMRR